MNGKGLESISVEQANKDTAEELRLNNIEAKQSAADEFIQRVWKLTATFLLVVVLPSVTYIYTRISHLETMQYADEVLIEDNKRSIEKIEDDLYEIK